MSENYLKVIEILGNAIINNELKISVLEYENKTLESKLKSIEENQKDLCESMNK